MRLFIYIFLPPFMRIINFLISEVSNTSSVSVLPEHVLKTLIKIKSNLSNRKVIRLCVRGITICSRPTQKSHTQWREKRNSNQCALGGCCCTKAPYPLVCATPRSPISGVVKKAPPGGWRREFGAKRLVKVARRPQKYTHVACYVEFLVGAAADRKLRYNLWSSLSSSILLY